ncbi:uncharacterized protein BDR25DRAFT_357386 [Lindgomyces ingoldianus]|uniref:Uncharacterized protein n=1 Tax=Lindgomyces ingoldianus TaxID=673940 RepID=A0ACB6QPG1_9PLEO|nr:uncharacterized protein BDR25DRAFT_357386 [Lindgomyces ingoldianus]KAF2468458.1 hypothetical protein BDR25DRAFT_357386 [Lindgomyces ingoldianus]
MVGVDKRASKNLSKMSWWFKFRVACLQALRGEGNYALGTLRSHSHLKLPFPKAQPRPLTGYRKALSHRKPCKQRSQLVIPLTASRIAPSKFHAPFQRLPNLVISLYQFGFSSILMEWISTIALSIKYQHLCRSVEKWLLCFNAHADLPRGVLQVRPRVVHEFFAASVFALSERPTHLGSRKVELGRFIYFPIPPSRYMDSGSSSKLMGAAEVDFGNSAPLEKCRVEAEKRIRKGSYTLRGEGMVSSKGEATTNSPASFSFSQPGIVRISVPHSSVIFLGSIWFCISQGPVSDFGGQNISPLLCIVIVFEQRWIFYPTLKHKTWIGAVVIFALVEGRTHCLKIFAFQWSREADVQEIENEDRAGPKVMSNSRFQETICVLPKFEEDKGCVNLGRGEREKRVQEYVYRYDRVAYSQGLVPDMGMNRMISICSPISLLTSINLEFLSIRQHICLVERLLLEGCRIKAWPKLVHISAAVADFSAPTGSQSPWLSFFTALKGLSRSDFNLVLGTTSMEE